jgi:hypothetical protein
MERIHIIKSLPNPDKMLNCQRVAEVRGAQTDSVFSNKLFSQPSFLLNATIKRKLLQSSIQVTNFEITKLALFRTHPYTILNAGYFHTAYYKKEYQKNIFLQINCLTR